MNEKYSSCFTSRQEALVESALNGYYRFLHNELVRIKKEIKDKNIMYVELVESFRNNLNIIIDLLGYEPTK